MAKYQRAAVRQVAAALAADSRLLIIDRLRQGPASSSELAAVAGIGLPAAHKQLAVLQEAGVISSDKIGRVVTHRLRPERLAVLSDWLQTRRSFWTSSFAALASAVAPASEEESR